jgi:hypothetical protein
MKLQAQFILTSGTVIGSAPHIRKFDTLAEVERAVFDSRNDPPGLISIDAACVNDAVVERFITRLRKFPRTATIVVQVVSEARATARGTNARVLNVA